MVGRGRRGGGKDVEKLREGVKAQKRRSKRGEFYNGAKVQEERKTKNEVER